MKGRRKRARACDGKKAHDTRQGATDSMNILIGNGAAGLRVYRCRFCGKWHVGHPTGTRRNR